MHRALRPAGWRFVTLSLLSLSTCFAALGCAGSSWKRELIYSVAPIALYREYRVEDSKKVPLEYEHPAEVAVEVVKAALSQMTYEQSFLLKADRTDKTFTEKEVEALAMPLCLALKEASPDERIRFLVTRSNWSDAFVGTGGTSAVVFSTQEGILNIAFDYLGEKLLGAESGDPNQVVFRQDPTAYLGATPVIPALGTRLYVDGEGQTYSRWLEITLADIKLLSAAEAKAAGIPEPKPPAEGAADPSKTTEAADKEGKASQETKSPPGSTLPPPASPGNEAQYRDIKTRVETLKRLRADGVLSEVEYQAQLEKVLSEAMEK